VQPWPSVWPRELSRVAAVVPHPDDEVFVAGLLHRAHRGGAHVTLICATRGERGWLFGKPATAEKVAPLRSQELARSCTAIGVNELVHLDLGDGLVAADKNAIGGAIEAAAPDLVVSYDIDGGYGHRDHIAVAEAVAACGRRWLRLAFPDGLWRAFGRKLARVYPELITESNQPADAIAWELELTDDGARAKRAAAAAHASQLSAAGAFLFADLEAEIFSRELYRE